MQHTLIARWIRASLFMLIGTAAVVAQKAAPDVAGVWDATVVVNGVEIPFKFDITGEGAAVKGAFWNGERQVPSTGGKVEGGVLTLHFDQYAATLTATLKDEVLEGAYDRGTRGAYLFRAKRFVEAVRTTAQAPSIDGVWTIPTTSAKGETAWRFIVRQTGADVSGTILRVDGDTGTLSGAYRDGAFILSHFAGSRPLLLEVTPQPDGTLRLVQNRKTTLVATRPDAAKATGAVPSDPEHHTTVKDTTEPFRFEARDFAGHVVTNTDARFKGKVLLVNITGSWCPNCHDEAPFLASLYKKYKSKGLEIVGLSFEEAEQLSDPVRLRAFIAHYGIEYTVLLAGEPEQLNEKLPQAEQLSAFPTTFLLGRDGRVRGVHTGFPSPGSGEFYTKAERDITSHVERLLAERAGSR